MLILGRKNGQKIIITLPSVDSNGVHEKIEILIDKSRRSDEVKVGIDAPMSVKILRDEVYQQLQ